MLTGKPKRMMRRAKSFFKRFNIRIRPRGKRWLKILREKIQNTTHCASAVAMAAPAVPPAGNGPMP